MVKKVGSTQTGEDMVAGRKNTAFHTTMVLGTTKWVRAKRRWERFDGRTILLVTPPGPTDPPSVNERFKNRPLTATDGLTAFGCMGGAGVRGIGNQPEGRRAVAGSGTGGHGVVGQGGTGDLQLTATSEYKNRHTAFNPGIGVLGIGGQWTMPIVSDSRGGPGVVGIGGHDGVVEPAFNELQGVGVFACGAPGAPGVRAKGKIGLEAKGEGDGFAGSGVGVVAHGAPDAAGIHATGLVGIEALGEETGVHATGEKTGVYATGPVGIRGDGRLHGALLTGGVGVAGFGLDGPGGSFESKPSEKGVPRAQVRLYPNKMWVPDETQASQYNLLPPDQVNQLPQRGQAGELLVTFQAVSPERLDESPPNAEATLWLCVRTGDDDPDNKMPPAIWKQVLLGPAITGIKSMFKG